MRKVLLNVLVPVAIAAGLLTLAEAGLRIAYPEKVLEIAEERRRIQELAYRFDPDYLVMLKPNIRKTYKRQGINGGETIEWQTNSAAFRGKELKTDPDLRIIVYGDSNIQARFSSLENTFVYRLREFLAPVAGGDVEVINAGIIGSGPDQSLLRLEDDVETYRPDIVVFHVFADNDFGDIVRNRLVELDDAGELVRTNYRARPDHAMQARQPRLLVVSAARKVMHMLSGKTAASVNPAGTAPGQSVDALLDLTSRQYEVYAKRRPRAVSHFADQYDYDIALQPDGESAAGKIRLLEAVLERARAVTAGNDAKLLVVIQPSSRDLTENLDINYRVLQAYPQYERDRLTSVVEAICKKRNIHSVNLYPLFSGNEPRTLFFFEDDHWNDAGQRLAARATASYIGENLLPDQGDNHL